MAGPLSLGDLSVSSGGTLKFTGGGSLTALSMTLGGNYNVALSGASNFISTTGNASLSSDITVDYTSFSNALYSPVKVIDAATFSGSFANHNYLGPALTLGQAVVGAVNGAGTGYEVEIIQQLILSMDRTTGIAAILNPVSTGNVTSSIDGYSI